MNPQWLLGGLSALLVLLGAGASLWMHGPNLLCHPQPRLILSPEIRELSSASAGLVFAFVVILFTRFSVSRYTWARRLHYDLRPIAQQLSVGTILLLALLSSMGEELLFRSFLTPWIGVFPQAIIFGFLHQMPGPSRWVWASWATVAGLVFGAVYEVTGSLSGPLLSHGLINAVNLLHLRRHTPPFPVELRSHKHSKLT